MKTVVGAAVALGLLAMGTTAAAAASPAYCDGYARNVANKKAGGNALGGAFLGGVGGAVVGGILGGNRGAGVGAVAGAAGGAVVGGSTWRKYYNAAYAQCMSSGPAPVVVPAGPAPGSAPWNQQCASKYTTFDGNSGFYFAWDGQFQPCTLP
jgi:hypothetical protein